MTTLGTFHCDSVHLLVKETINVRGNRVSDCYGTNVIGINVKNCKNLRMRDNQAVRIQPTNGGTSTAIKVSNCEDVLMVYHVASRADLGYAFSGITTFAVYNLTAHNCDKDITTSSSGTFRNFSLTAYEDWKNYRNCTGLEVTGTATVDLDYVKYFGLDVFYAGSVTPGSNITEDKPLYFNEPQDDLTPDHISNLINVGTANPLLATGVDIGGIESEVTNEVTAPIDFYYNLLDNSFWNIEDKTSPQVSFIKAFQSRVLANCELATKTVVKDVYIKFANSLERFAEVFPSHQHYHNKPQYKRQVADLWYGTQNPAVLYSYNTGIGGYNLFPSFFKRYEDIADGWIIATSDIEYDNWLGGYENLKYGMVIDFLGTSTMSKAASAECYRNVQRTIADVAPVRWNLHNEPEPANYLLFTDMYNGYEDCALTNMIYGDEFGISPDVVPGDCALETPLLSTSSIITTTTGGASASGYAEISMLDHVFSETASRKLYHRQGPNASNMGAWSELTHPISQELVITAPYVQFKVEAKNVLRRIDYEFTGICLRPYTTSKIDTELDPLERPWLNFSPGDAIYFPFAGLQEDRISLLFAAGSQVRYYWDHHFPQEFVRKVAKDDLKAKFYFYSLTAGTAVIEFEVQLFEESQTTPYYTKLYSKEITVPAALLPTDPHTLVELDMKDWTLTESTNRMLLRMIRNTVFFTDDTLADTLHYSAGYITTDV